ncbi:hypothetical protein B0J18DRAFT_365741 [Chaetomium sp. MPI-SDFR-AT-0129]|nr:hypothetical protein B0J18DRAFT_365741 [Chaetomium sp. MPI-SDFR-AT-0129]
MGAVASQHQQVECLSDYQKRLASVTCNKCGTHLAIDTTSIMERTERMLGERRYFHPFQFCARCKGWSCVSCDQFHKGDGAPILKDLVSGKNFKTAWCCDQGRMFLLLSLLTGPEQGKQRTPKNRRTTRQMTLRAATVEAEQSKAKGKRRNGQQESQLSKGTGYGDGLVSKSKQMAVSQASEADLDVLLLYFEALVSVLPSSNKKLTVFDTYPQPLVFEMITKSPLVEETPRLLRNSSLEEISARRNPLVTVLGFLETIASHDSTRGILLDSLVRFPAEEQLPNLNLEAPDPQSTATVTHYETMQPLVSVIEQLAIPFRNFVEGSRRLGGEAVGRDAGGLLPVLERVCNIADELNAMLKQRVAMGHADNDNREFTAQSAEWHRENCVKPVPDEIILSGHTFVKEAEQAAKTKFVPNRMRKLLAQVSSLMVDLPDGIYVRHGESRVDVMKVIIVGPVGSPYEHGLFEFDMFCPSEFPKSPPAMHFRTTGNGEARFNPNLYASGKVCFSLLGTWAGQPWDPNQSTLLQLLVSIQAMIFTDAPYYNEPGYELKQDIHRSESYNRCIEDLTVRHAILYWLVSRLAPPKQPLKRPSSKVAEEPGMTARATGKKMMVLADTEGASINLDLPTPPPPVKAAEPQPPLPPAVGQSSLSASAVGSQQYNLGMIAATNTMSAQAGPSAPSAPSAPHGGFAPAVLPGLPGSSNLNVTMPGQMQPAAAQTLSVLPLSNTGSGSAPSVTSLEFARAKIEGVPFPVGQEDPVFSDIIRHHFQLKAKAILATVRRWEKLSTTVTAGQMAMAAPRIERLLQQHGFHD